MVVVVEYVPALQLMHGVVDVVVYVPASQDVHCAGDVSPGVFEYDPDGQRSQ